MSNDIDFGSGLPRILRWLLGIIGVGLMTAAFAIFLPVSWMAWTHEWLGLGEFSDTPITIYLARSTSMLYAAHGTLMLIAALKINKYWGLVPVFGWLHVVMGLTMFGIDITSGMPTYWTAGEGIPIAIAGLVIVAMFRKVESSNANSS